MFLRLVALASSLALVLAATPVVQASCPDFLPFAGSPMPVAGNSIAVVSGDFNHDGNPDLVSANWVGGTLSVLLGHGDGTFATHVDYEDGGLQPYSVATGDLDGDGELDLVASNYYGGVGIFLGVGDGTFGARVEVPAGGTPISTTIGDWNQDGKADLAVANYGGAAVSVLLGAGDGTFQSAISYPAGNAPYSVASADFDRDGDLDLSTTDALDATVSVLLGNGDGTFATRAAYPVGTNASAQALADLDRDGRIDIAVANYVDSTVSILLGQGDGTFLAGATLSTDISPTGIALVDFDRDGLWDLVTANNEHSSVSVFLGHGDATFAPRVDFGGGSVARAVTAGDFDRDGRPDLAIANLGGPQVSLLLNRCSAVTCGAPAFADWVGSPLAAGSMPVDAAVADFDRDGIADLAVVGNAGSLRVFFGQPGGEYASPVEHAVGGSPYGIETADLDRDGDVDVVVAAYSDVRILLGDGVGGFAPAVAYAAGAGAVASVIADFDRDGALDLAVADYAAGTVSLLRGNGDGSFQGAVTWAAGPGAYQLAAADLDRDGDLDLAVPASGSSAVSLLLGNGDGTFAPPADYATGASAQSVAVGDFDRDGDLDLAVACYSENVLTVYAGNGDGTFAGRIDYAAGTNARTVAANDFDRDGILDLVVSNANGGNSSLLLGLGDGTFAPHVDYPAGAGPVALVAADLDVDGREDFAVMNFAGGSVSVLRNVCVGALSPPPTVLAVQTVFDSGNDQLEENEPTRVAIYDLVVTLSEPVANAHYGVGQNGFLSTGSFLLVADGGDFTLETANCATGAAAASDAGVGIASAYFDAASRRVTLHLADGYLHDAHYRLFVCSGSSLIDADDQQIDGDGDGIAGDDFARSYQVDMSAPNAAAMPESLEHDISSCSNQPTFTMSWSGASDEPGGSGVAGYSFLWTDNSSAMPDDVIDVAHGNDPQLLTETLSESTSPWFFRLFTCDRAGNCSGSPSPAYVVDLTGPAASTYLYSSHLLATPSADATISMGWTPSVDGICGLGGYSWTFTHDANPVCPGTVQLSSGATLLPDEPIGDGSWYFHLCAVDHAGNWGPSAVSGPYLIDTTGPGPVTELHSPTHATPSSEGRIEVAWTPPVDAIAGIGGYWWSFDTEPTYACPNSATGPAGATTAATEVLAPGTYYFHICAVDALGNWSAAVDGGPYVIEPSPDAAQYVYFSDDGYNTIERMRTDGSERVVLLAGLAQPWGIAVDDAAGKIYWAEGGLAAIRRANLDGSAIETIVSGTGGVPFDLALDTARGKIYWTEYPNGGYAIRRANLDGSEIEDLVTSGLSAPIGLGLDLAADRVYWGEQGSPGRIARVALDGSGHEVLYENGGFIDVAVDAAHDRIYTTVTSQAYSGGIVRAHRDGSALTGITPALPYPLLVALDPAANRLYWTDLIAHTVERIYVDGTGRETLASGIGQARGIALSNAAMEPHETVAPENPTAFTSTHPESGWSNVATIGFTWSGAADEPGGSGLAGYSFVLDTVSGTVPDHTLEVPQTSDPHSTSVPAGEGDHYIHLVTCDIAGNCSTALEHGPYRVDLTPPSAPAITASSHSATPIADTTIDVSWSASGDAASGVDGYGYLFSTLATASCPATKLVGETTFTATSAALSPGSWYFHLCAVDVAGNWSAAVTGGPYEISTTLPTVRLVDSAGQGIAGAVATYYQAGWKPFGTTGADGRVALAIPPASYPFRISYGGAVVQKTQHIGTTPEVLFATRDVTIRFRDSGGGALDASSTEYYGGGWRPFGSTSGGEVHRELLPASYTFALTYLGQRNTKAQDVGANPEVLFQTCDVAIRFRDSLGGTLDSAVTEFYAGGWRTFGSTVGGEVHKELLPASYTFALTYLGQRNTRAQDVVVTPVVLFETRDVAIRLRDSLGNPLEASATEFYAGGWRAFGSTVGGEVHKELLPASYTFALTYLGQRNTRAQDVGVNSEVLFETRDVVIRLQSSTGGALDTGTTEFYAGGWRAFGSTVGGEVHKELLPAPYTFALTYLGQRNTKVQDIATSPDVLFQTGAVVSASATCNGFYAGGWRTFTQGMQLLPATYTFRFTSGTPAQQAFAITAATTTAIR